MWWFRSFGRKERALSNTPRCGVLGKTGHQAGSALSLVSGFFAFVEGLAQSIEQVTALHFATFGFVQVGPQRGASLRIDQGNLRVAWGDRFFRKSVQTGGAGKLSVGNSTNVRAASEDQNEVSFILAGDDVKTAPLIELQQGGVLEFGKSGLVLEEDGVGGGDGLRKSGVGACRQGHHPKNQDQKEWRRLPNIAETHLHLQRD